MAISLSKGQNVSLTKTAPAAKKFLIGLGWDARATAGDKFDLDASAFLLTEAGKVGADSDLVFYGAKQHPSNAVIHSGDNLTGEGEGDDETIIVDTAIFPAGYQKVAVACTIDQAEVRRQSFGQVNNAYIRIIDADTNTELARYDLSEDYSVETALIFGEFYLANGEWKFKAVGQGFANGLKGLCDNYGVNAD